MWHKLQVTIGAMEWGKVYLVEDVVTEAAACR